MSKARLYYRTLTPAWRSSGRGPVPSREAVGIRADLGPHRPLRGQGAPRARRARAESPVPQPEGRDDARPPGRADPAHRAGRRAGGAALQGGRDACTFHPNSCTRSKPSRTATCSRRRRPSSTIWCVSRTATAEADMQVIIPLAGKGTRLRPHTHLVPKPLLKVAGRPVMDWVMDRLDGLDVSELIFITGHLKEQVEAYARARYQIPSRFIEQKVQDGTAGAVNLARPSRARAGADHLRGHGVRGGSHADQPYRRRRDHLGQGGRGLPALRRGGDRRRGLHDPHRREAEHARSPSSPTSGSTTSGRWTACGRGSTTCWPARRTRANTSSPTPSSG